MIDFEDMLTQLEGKLKSASLIESDIFNDYASANKPDMLRFKAGYERMQTLHSILRDYLDAALRALEEAEEALAATRQEA